jgi:hypothetical protein
MSQLSRSVRLLLSIASVLFTLSMLCPAAVADAPPPDMTGTWQGAITCKGFFQGQPFTQVSQGLLFITQTNADINMEFQTNFYNGAVIMDADNSTKGQGPLIGCGAQAQPFGDYNEIGRFEALVNAETGKTSFKATSIRVVPGDDQAINNTFGYVATCKWKFVRTSATNPNVSACPF